MIGEWYTWTLHTFCLKSVTFIITTRKFAFGAFHQCYHQRPHPYVPRVCSRQPFVATISEINIWNMKRLKQLSYNINHTGRKCKEFVLLCAFPSLFYSSSFGDIRRTSVWAKRNGIGFKEERKNFRAVISTSRGSCKEGGWKRILSWFLSFFFYLIAHEPIEKLNTNKSGKDFRCNILYHPKGKTLRIKTGQRSLSAVSLL